MVTSYNNKMALVCCKKNHHQTMFLKMFGDETVA